MKIISHILESNWFHNKPPVLIDIGASGEINAKWKPIAKYAVCLAFDADDREFNVSEKSNSGYLRLITINRIVTAQPTPSTHFYLTKSPFCSSLLQPNAAKLQPWNFSPLFTVEKKISLPAITVAEALAQAGQTYIDWFKTDTQGTDLRLFQSLPDEIRNQILAAEFEPGIIDAYDGEDKLFSILKQLPEEGFWLSTMDVKGTQRINHAYSSQFGQYMSERIVRRSPCWSELTYLKNPTTQNERSLLLLYVFAMLERQYGFALEIADKAKALYKDNIFNDCHAAAMARLKGEKWKLPLVMAKKQFNKLFAKVNA
ncbi:MAG: hypothetical protein H7Y27_16030 [Gemmatimonadaceae bacterium]|nr:hypothetical protein [Chitinophagaceae bacterium]